MRTILLTGPKGGTGKTTTAVNLAALAANRGQKVLLVDADPGCCVAYFHNQDPTNSGELEPLTDTGTFWPKLANGADVITPYAQGSSSQNQLEHFLKVLTTWVRDEAYDLVILDAPPMMGARARALLRIAEEVLLVLRAEPMSFQLLPAYIEMAKRETPPGRVTRFLGILMTLAIGQKANDPDVELLQSRFKGILPNAIPFDNEVNESVMRGVPVVVGSVLAPATKAYHDLAKLLKLVSPN